MADVDIRVKAKDEASGILKSISQGILQGFGQAAFGAITNAIGGATQAMAGFVMEGISKASNLNESINKTNVVFGDSADAMIKWSETAATSIGMSQQSALDAAGGFAVFGKAAGLAGADVTKFAQEGLSRAADMASIFNTSVEDASLAMQAAFRGETEPIRRYGVMLDDATMRQKALALGIVSTTKEALTPQQKVLAANALIMESTAFTMGDFQNTADGMANSQRILNAQIENAQAQLGTMFLPIVTKVMGFLNTQGIPILQNLIKEFQTFAGPILAQAGAMFEAFQASMSGAQTPFEGLQKVLDVFGGWWKINGPFIIPVVRQIGEAMNKAFTAIGKQVLPALQSAFQKVSVWFYQNGPLINKVIKTIGDVITNNILPALVAFGGVIGPLFEGIVNIVMGAVQLIMQLITGDWAGAWATAGQIFADFATAIWGALTGLFATILALFGTSLTKIKVIWAANWNALKQIIATVTNMIMTTIINWLRSIITSIIGFAVNLYTAWKSAWDGLINAVIEATAGVIVAVITLVTNVIAAIQAQIVNFLAIGAAIVKAIQDGITAAWNAFLTWLIDLVKGLITSILALFGIGGEGADAMQAAGYGMMQSFARGILQGAGLPRMALATVSMNMGGGLGMGGGAYNSPGGMRTSTTYQRNNIYGPVTLQMNGGRGTELLKIK